MQSQLLSLFETEEELPVVEYRQLDGVYYLHTISVAAVRELRKLGIKTYLESSTYVGRTKSLPKSDTLLLSEHKVVIPTEDKVKSLEVKYSQYLKMMNAFRAMEKEILKQEAKIVDALLKSGLKIKVGSPKDSQLFIAKAKTRLHYQQSMRKSISEEALEKLAQKDPDLAKCFDKETINIINEDRLLEVLEKKPSSVSSSIIEYTASHSFVETKISKHECKHCGGKIHKATKQCKRCGQ